MADRAVRREVNEEGRLILAAGRVRSMQKTAEKSHAKIRPSENTTMEAIAARRPRPPRDDM